MPDDNIKYTKEIPEMCKVLELCESAYYQWLKGEKNRQEKCKKSANWSSRSVKCLKRPIGSMDADGSVRHWRTEEASLASGKSVGS